MDPSGSSRQDLIPILLEKIGKTSKDLAGSVLEGTTLPFLSDMLKLGKERGMDWKSPSFQMLFTETLQHYVLDAMRPEPPLPQQITPRQLGCGCVRCERLDKFLANDAVREESFKEYAKERKHLESRLERVQTRHPLHWSSRREGKGPEVLRVNKTDGHHEYKEWQRQRGKIRDRLKSIAPWEELSMLTGSSSAKIVCTTDRIPRLDFPDRLPSSLVNLSEPKRMKTWLAECFVADPAAQITQAELWEIYTLTMDAVSPKRQKLSATDFFNLVPNAIAGARTEAGTPYVVKGMRRWKRSPDAGADDTTSALAGAQRSASVAVANGGRGNDAANTQAAAGSHSLKRKIDVVDLAESP